MNAKRAVVLVIWWLVVIACGMQAQQQQSGTVRDQRRIADLKKIHIALKAFYRDHGFLPTTAAYGKQNPGGWDYSSEGGFLPFLQSKQYLRDVPKDPINNGTGDVFYGGTGYSYAYYCYPGENSFALGAKLESGKLYWVANPEHEKGFVCKDSLETAATIAKALKDTGAVSVYGILFDTNKTAIKPESRATLDEVAKLLKTDPYLKLEVAGHTDNTGSAQHNMTLSKGRADAIVRTLVKTYGINAARLHAKGYGATKPVAANDSEEGRAKNRRVELRKL